ncbi:TPA: hypothetical protein HA351_07285 [Methanosarcinaceae archaeon]|nr:hypothetical protein [Methanosarcinaceae archaeon]
MEGNKKDKLRTSETVSKSEHETKCFDINKQEPYWDDPRDQKLGEIVFRGLNEYSLRKKSKK